MDAAGSLTPAWEFGVSLRRFAFGRIPYPYVVEAYVAHVVQNGPVIDWARLSRFANRSTPNVKCQETLNERRR